MIQSQIQTFFKVEDAINFLNFNRKNFDGKIINIFCQTFDHQPQEQIPPTGKNYSQIKQTGEARYNDKNYAHVDKKNNFQNEREEKNNEGKAYEEEKYNISDDDNNGKNCDDTIIRGDMRDNFKAHFREGEDVNKLNSSFTMDDAFAGGIKKDYPNPIMENSNSIALKPEMSFAIEKLSLIEKIDEELNIDCHIQNGGTLLYFDGSDPSLKDKIIKILETIKVSVFPQPDLISSTDFLNRIPYVNEIKTKYNIGFKVFGPRTFILYTQNKDINLLDFKNEISNWLCDKYYYYDEGLRNSRSPIMSYHQIKRIYQEKIIIPNLRSKITDGKEKEILAIVDDNVEGSTQGDGVFVVMRSKNKKKFYDIWSQIVETMDGLTEINFSARPSIIKRIKSLYIDFFYEDHAPNFIFYDELDMNNYSHLYIFGDLDSITDYFSQIQIDNAQQPFLWARMAIYLNHLQNQEIWTKFNILSNLNKSEIISKLYINKSKNFSSFEVYINGIGDLFRSISAKQNKGYEPKYKPGMNHRQENHRNKNKSNTAEYHQDSSIQNYSKDNQQEPSREIYIKNVIKAENVLHFCKTDKSDKPSWENFKISDTLDKFLLQLKKQKSLKEMNINEVQLFNWKSLSLNLIEYLEPRAKDNLEVGFIIPIQSMEKVDSYLNNNLKTSTFEISEWKEFYKIGTKFEEIDIELLRSKGQIIIYIIAFHKELFEIVDSCTRPVYKLSIIY